MATDHHRNAETETDAGGSATDEQTYVFSREKEPTLAVLEAVSSATGTDELELSPLYEVVDPDALDALFDAADPSPSEALSVSFSYAGFDVEIEGGPATTVTLEESDADGRA